MDGLAELEGIPAAARVLWKQLCAEELRPVHELFKEVRAYQQALAKRSTWQDDDFDPQLARSLADASLKLLGTLNEDTPEPTRRLVQAAVRYFVIEDDAEVVNAVLRHLGYQDWIVNIP